MINSSECSHCSTLYHLENLEVCLNSMPASRKSLGRKLPSYLSALASPPMGLAGYAGGNQKAWRSNYE